MLDQHLSKGLSTTLSGYVLRAKKNIIKLGSWQNEF